MRGSSLIRFLIGFLLVVLVALLMGCRSNPPKPPQVVEVIVEKIVPVPEKLAAPCDLVPRRDNTIGEAVRLANARLASLEECNKRLAEIRKLGQP